MEKGIYNLKYGFFAASNKGYAGFRKRVRLQLFAKLLGPKSKDKILEIGCNDGSLTMYLSQFSHDVYGIDINDEYIKQLANEKIKVMSATDLNFPDNYFDKVGIFEVIEHIREVEKVFTEAYRVLKKRGKLFISFPLELFRGQNVLFISLLLYKNPLYARKIHVHKLTPRKIKKIIENIPFEVIHSSIKFIPFPSYVMILKKI